MTNGTFDACFKITSKLIVSPFVVKRTKLQHSLRKILPIPIGLTQGHLKVLFRYSRLYPIRCPRGYPFAKNSASLAIAVLRILLTPLNFKSHEETDNVFNSDAPTESPVFYPPTLYVPPILRYPTCLDNNQKLVFYPI